MDGQDLAVFRYSRKHVVSIYDTYGIAWSLDISGRFSSRGGQGGMGDW
jgi:hypothetical protein